MTLSRHRSVTTSVTHPGRRALLVAVVGAGVGASALTGCSSAPSAPSWRDVDACALIDQQQLAEIGDDPSLLKVLPVDDPKRTGCTYTDPYGMSRFVVGLDTETPKPNELPAGTVVRTFPIRATTAYVTRERSGSCELTIPLRDVQLAITIKPTPGKTTVALGDSSAVSCDAQIPLITTIVDRTGLSWT